MTNSKVRDNQLSFAGLVAICVSAMIGSAIFDLPKNMGGQQRRFWPGLRQGLACG
ncbi:hypothetical protein PO252_05765 [Limosilactobacillus mucosae]|uniref:hypothetical protein n=1 Tax=Limosilactobacillus mucosae TaxID=97478 RepID=UPI00233E8D40|nr:hypothetical protein [Limosilactobacillus mucosae]MDC2839329.1 hypothetical protein [Limosilactobacillus mucosae]